MANYHFVIGIREKIPIKLSGPDYIVTDNSDYKITLVPDAEWDGLEAKTIYYVYDNGTSVQNPIIGNQDTMPIIQTSGNVHIGVSAGELHTTQYLSIPLKPSVRRKAGRPIEPPSQEVYDKIMALINQILSGSGNLDDVVQYGEGDPTGELAGETKQFYINKLTWELWTCTKGGETSWTEWKKISTKTVLSGTKDPTKEVVVGEVDQLYVKTDTGAIYICTFASNGPMWYEWTWKQIGGTGSGGNINVTYDETTGDLSITSTTGGVSYDDTTGNLTIGG